MIKITPQQTNLNISNLLIFKIKYDRPNIRYRCIYATTNEEKDIEVENIFKIYKNLSGIIYC